uniref:Uncharacterized protein n=1 Tax=Panagrolaimus davidi TaxID=227884 RepID=A0A914QAB5_9BILA
MSTQKGSRDSKEGPQDGHEKDPVRVAAGHKAYETRLRHEREGSAGSGNDDGDQNDGKDPQKVEAGKKGGAARRGSTPGGDGKDPQKVEAGKKGGAAQRGTTPDRDGQDDDGLPEKDPVRVAAGHKAYETRLRHEREGSAGSGNDDGDQNDGKDPQKAYETRLRHEREGSAGSGNDDGDQNDGKDPQKVEAGKKGGAARRGSTPGRDGKDPQKVEAGKKGGAARRGTTPGPDSGDDEDMNDGKDPVRVAAGRKAYETRLRHEQEGYDGRGDENHRGLKHAGDADQSSAPDAKKQKSQD